MTTNAAVLDELRWHRRLIVAFGTESDRHVVEFKKHVNSAVCGIAERAVNVYLIYESGADGLTTAAEKLDTASIERLKKNRNKPEAAFELLLIGKDGGTKAFSEQPDDLFRFLELIDGMPMHHAEAKLQKSTC